MSQVEAKLQSLIAHKGPDAVRYLKKVMARSLHDIAPNVTLKFLVNCLHRALVSMLMPTRLSLIMKVAIQQS